LPELQLLSSLLSPAVISTFGPFGVFAFAMLWMLWFWARGREERQARINEEHAKALREDQREIFQRLNEDIDRLTAEKSILETRLRIADGQVVRWRGQAFDYYAMARDNYHAAANARAALIAAGLKTKADFEAFPITSPSPPQVNGEA